MSSQSAINRRGMLAMIGATAGFAVNDAMMKYLVGVMPVSEAMVLRGIVAAGLAYVVLVAGGHAAALPQMRRKSVLLRAFFEAAVVVVYMQALRAIPLGLATSILQATPLMMTAFAALAGRETVGPARWGAVLVGFIGVLMIVQPDSSGVEPAMAIAVLTAVLVTFRDLSNRLVPAGVPLFVIVLAASLGNVVAGGLMIFAESTPWRMPNALEASLLVGAALFVLVATTLITFSFRGTEVSAVSPFRYAGVPVALLIGFAVWGDLPNFIAALGIFLVICAGLFAMRDEARRGRLAKV